MNAVSLPLCSGSAVNELTASSPEDSPTKSPVDTTSDGSCVGTTGGAAGFGGSSALLLVATTSSGSTCSMPATSKNHTSRVIEPPLRISSVVAPALLLAA